MLARPSEMLGEEKNWATSVLGLKWLLYAGEGRGFTRIISDRPPSFRVQRGGKGGGGDDRKTGKRRADEKRAERGENVHIVDAPMGQGHIEAAGVVDLEELELP